MSAPGHPIRRRDRALDLRFAAGHPDLVDREIEKDLSRTAVLRIRIERATGKARR